MVAKSTMRRADRTRRELRIFVTMITSIWIVGTSGATMGG
jgi:hypothetical protein